MSGTLTAAPTSPSPCGEQAQEGWTQAGWMGLSLQSRVCLASPGPGSLADHSVGL